VIGTFQPGKEKELQEFLNIISTRRMRASVMPWLPEKDRQLIELPMTKEQKEYIAELNSTFEIGGTDVNAVNILAKLIKVRQILLSPVVLGLKGSSPKIDWIKQYIKDYPEKNILIFSNFTEWLKLLGKELDCNNFIIGDTTKKQREHLKNEFQNGNIKLLLINIKAGKEGITLDNADTIIFTDKYPPVGDIQQAEDRFVATTKDKLNTGHTIIDLVMDNSYEQNILRLLKNNASEVDIVNNYIDYLKGGE
jgi:SNF2 family DNA or RNA helicase